MVRKVKEMEKVTFKDENNRVYHGWKILVVGILLVVFGYSCIITITGLFILPVTTDLGFSVGDFSIYITIFSVVSIFALLLLTKAMTKKHIKKVMVISAALGGISFVGFYFATQLWHFYVFAVPMGFCFGCLTSAPLSILVNNWFGSKIKGLVQGILFSTVTTMILINIMNILVLNVGWRLTYLIIAICLFVVCIPLILIFIKWCPQDLGIERIGETKEDIDASEGEKGYAGVTFKEAIKKPITWLAFISGALLVVASSSILVHSVTFLTTEGYSPAVAGVIYSVMIGSITLGNIITGLIIDRISLKVASWVTVIGFLAAFGSGLMLSHAHWLIAVYIAGYSFAAAGVTVVSPLIPKFMYGEKEIAPFISYVNVFISVGAAFGATITGMLFDAFGSYAPAWMILSGIVVVGGIIRGVCTSKKHKFVVEESEQIEEG